MSSNTNTVQHRYKFTLSKSADKTLQIRDQTSAMLCTDIRHGHTSHLILRIPTDSGVCPCIVFRLSQKSTLPCCHSKTAHFYERRTAVTTLQRIVVGVYSYKTRMCSAVDTSNTYLYIRHNPHLVFLPTSSIKRHDARHDNHLPCTFGVKQSTSCSMFCDHSFVYKIHNRQNKQTTLWRSQHSALCTKTTGDRLSWGSLRFSCFPRTTVGMVPPSLATAASLPLHYSLITHYATDSVVENNSSKTNMTAL